uniref:Uncharacterized protein n=1 Tax=Arundo donax TaxID=35708 RepID=A0A0A9C0K4_ARUDO
MTCKLFHFPIVERYKSRTAKF